MGGEPRASTGCVAPAQQDRAPRALLDAQSSSGHAVTTAEAGAGVRATCRRIASPGRADCVGGMGSPCSTLMMARLRPNAPRRGLKPVQALAAHASACLSHITAVRTAQAMRHDVGRGRRHPSRIPADRGRQQRPPRMRACSSRKSSCTTRPPYEPDARSGICSIACGPKSIARGGSTRSACSPAVGARAAYFQQELVHTLADGDSALLGGTV